MKKIFNKLTKYLLLIAMIFSDLMTPIKVLAEETTVKPQKGDVGINETVSENADEVSVTKGSLESPGDVQVTKTVKKNGEGKFTIEFEVKGNDAESTSSVSKPIYAVVVFDRSSSMCDDSTFMGICFANGSDKWNNAVDGAKTFATTLLGTFSNAKLALVAFSTRVNTLRSFQSANFSNVNFGSPDGVTNLNGALNRAKELLDGAPSNTTKYIVVISDGAPTDSGGHETQTAANEVIATANSIKEDGTITIYSIGYETNSTTSATLKAVSSGDDYFMEADAGAIAGKFEEVAESITTYANAGTGATINDTIGANFSVAASSSNLVTVTGSSVSNTEPFDITEEGTKISFDVEINGDEADGWVNVNEGFTLNYTDANGNSAVITYGSDEPQPQVYWERNTYNYVINYYKDEITNTNDSEHYLGTSGNISAYNGDVINLTDTEKNAFLSQAGEGYELSSSNVYTITIDKTKDNVINVLYEKIDLNYIVKYFFEDNNNYVENESLRVATNPCKYGDTVNVLDKALTSVPTGYVLDETKTKAEATDGNGNYTITVNDTVVSVYYKKQEFTYSVEYLFQDLNGNYVKLENIQDVTGITAKYGDVVSYSDHLLATVPEGYIPDVDMSKSVTDNNDGKYIIINNNTKVSIYYKRVNCSFTVNYHFNGTPFDEAYTGEAVYGDTLNASDYVVENIDNTNIKNKYSEEDYFLDPTNESNSASITVGTDGNVMNLYYITTFFEEDAEETTKSSDTEKVTTSEQEIDYTITYKNTIKNVREGDVITVTVVDTLPFEIDESASNLKITDNGVEVEGVYDNSAKTITWTFTETATSFTASYDIEKNISFTVVYKDFADISASDNNELVNTASGMTTINNDSTDGDTSDTEEIPVEIKGNLIVHHYEKDTTNKVYDDEITNNVLVGTSYETNYRTDIIGYTVDNDNIPTNKDGKYVEGTTVVTYYYVRKDGEITDTTTDKVFVREEGKTRDEVDSIDSTFNYTITGTATIKDYVGSYKVEATDNLPYKLDTTDMEELDDGTYKVNDKCIYDGNKTITCTSETKNITGDMYDENKEYSVSETFTLSIKYLDITEKTVSNSAAIKVILDNNDSTSEEDSADVVVNEGDLTVIYRSADEVFESTTTTKLAGTEYTTSEKTFFGYHLDDVKGNRDGKYLANQTVTVEYIYVLNEGEIVDNKVTKEGPETIEDVRDFVEYTITYTGTIKDYIGTATLTITDTPSYQINYAGYDDRCDYDYENNIFTCIVEYDITEEDYVDGVFTINETFYINVLLSEIDSNIITNNVDSKLELREVYKDSDDSVDSEVEKGEILVNYVDEDGNVLDSYTESGFAGEEYSTSEKSFDGYTIKSNSKNTEGVYLANTSIYIEYVYGKNVGTYEELPPQTGIEDINVNYIKYLIAAILLFLFDKKNKEAKNN